MPPELFDPDWIEKFLQRAGWWAPFAFILLRIAAIMVTVVPNAPLDIAGGALFGPFWGTVYSLLGSEAGAIVCFLLARSLGREAITRLLHREITFCDRIADRHLVFVVLFARLEPIFSFALVSYGAGLTRMSLRTFALSTLVGMTPGTIILNYYGKSFFSGNHLPPDLPRPRLRHPHPRDPGLDQAEKPLGLVRQNDRARAGKDEL